MASSSILRISDAGYASALVAALQFAYPRKTRLGLARMLGISINTLRKLSAMQMELNLPLQLLIESKLDPTVVQDLHARFTPRPLPYWLAKLGENP